MRNLLPVIILIFLFSACGDNNGERSGENQPNSNNTSSGEKNVQTQVELNQKSVEEIEAELKGKWVSADGGTGFILGDNGNMTSLDPGKIKYTGWKADGNFIGISSMQKDENGNEMEVQKIYTILELTDNSLILMDGEGNGMKQEYRRQ
ncbi:lipocalin family protein [Ignavibacteria bacterium CHB1]|nr:MAG: hypothetical protein EDM69_06255 [Chlorobiota bacterium]MBV6399710.1 hypothetical protein [Ignavibacteria bacterium]MCC6885226.1 hypothetical protein [Ignavibacteriales bacterium]MCE7953371.1 hypothetical protein [Chlorobi bacterium CHB7]MDL1887213.1 lipocalin family protein [Ignavibacteria bacterium CHB1]RIK47737.1 MAG: hypothetical protein DCC60_09835 [Ignavibacteriota bacterium]